MRTPGAQSCFSDMVSLDFLIYSPDDDTISSEATW